MRRLLVLLLAAGLGGCQKDRAQSGNALTAADTVAAVKAGFTEAAFDTIHWPSDSLRLARGADVFKWGCAECHGPQGYGNGGKVLNGDTLRPPNFHDPKWRLAGDTDAVRRMVYSGNVRGMPHWGLRRMDPRDIDAVAAYVLQVLHRTS